ncbi:TonB-dependent receptor [Flavisphingomonas formosensis]|uniref:TonB-dependent receptor n=1 Tax=Flavisphingomonas formosensis TaxID=861534 RepID=UPI001E2EA47E|nr:TonB-dependent receptor [Sphingomonas formosensis]
MKGRIFMVRSTPLLLAGTALAVVAGPAFAQDASPPAAAAAEAAPAPANAGDIVVTATRRAERLQDVPIAVSALGSKQIESRKIDNFAAITRIAPGPTFVPVKGTSVITVQIRGQASTNDATGLENPVAVYIDDLYYGSLASFDANLFDVGQIAVLRGPQGTTFGRNAVGGALQITSNPAVIGETSGKITVTGLRFDGGQTGIESDGYVNLPISDNAAFRLAYSVKNDDGYQKNLMTGHDLADNRVASVRGSLTWEPTDRLRVQASASYTNRWGRGDGPVAYGPGAIAAAVRAATGGDLHKTLLDDDGRTRRKIFAGLVRLEYRTDIGTISSITGYRSLKASLNEDADGGPLPSNFPSLNTNDEKQVSQEFRFTSNWGGRFSLLAGVYASYEDLAHAIGFGFNGTLSQTYLSVLTKGLYLQQTVDSGIKNRSIGPYIEGKYKITDTLSFTAGLRYSYERKSGYVSHVGSSPFYGAPYYQKLPGPNSGTDHWDAFTPRFILNYTPERDMMFYASVSKGFQGGGWVMTKTNAAAAQIPLAAMTTWSYEIGTKSSFFDHLLTTNIAAFLADTSNLQVRSLVQGVLNDTNAGKQRVKGVEVEAVLRPVRGLSLGVNYAYTDSYYSKFEGCAVGVSCTGNKTPFVSKNDFTFLIDYDHELANGGTLAFHFDDQFASPYQLAPNNLQKIAVPLTRRRNVANASLTYTPPGGRFDIRLWARNLFDKQYISNGLNYNFYLASPSEVSAAGGLSGIDVERLTVAPPRTIGITATMRFGKSS